MRQTRLRISNSAPREKHIGAHERARAHAGKKKERLWVPLLFKWFGKRRALFRLDHARLRRSRRRPHFPGVGGGGRGDCRGLLGRFTAGEPKER